MTKNLLTEYDYKSNVESYHIIMVSPNGLETTITDRNNQPTIIRGIDQATQYVELMNNSGRADGTVFRMESIR
jgi:hypothetical protein